MLRYITLLCVIPFLVNCWEDYLVNGPCPEPPKAEDKSKWNKITGRWWLEKSNRQWLIKHPISCAEAFIGEIKNDIVHVILSIKDKNGKCHEVKERLDPIKDQPGNWLINIYDKNTKKYKLDGWKYTIVKIDDGGILYYGCKNEGNKHQSFYQLLVSKDKKLRSAFDRAEFAKAYEESNDKRKMITIPHIGCD